MTHSQKRRGQNTTPANRQKTRDPTPTPTEKGAFQTTRNPTGQRRSQHPPNPRTNQLGAAQPPPGKPTESGRKDMHCTHEGQRAEKTRKSRKRQEKTRKGTHCTPRAKRPKRGSAVQNSPPNSSTAHETAKPKSVAQSRKVIKWLGMPATS
jgi:hypothetical protein